MKPNVIILFIILILLGVICYYTFSSGEPKAEVTDTPLLPQLNEVKEPETKKSDVEVYSDLASSVVDLGKTAIENKRYKDSVNIATKEKMYVYQIGLPMKKTDDVFDLYNKLEEKGIRNIYVFKSPDDDYILVQYEDKSMDELYDNRKAFKDSLSEVTSEKIDVINLNEFCRKKRKANRNGVLSKRKEKYEIPCLVCD